MGLWDKIHSLLVDLEIGKRLGGKDCYFQGHIGKDPNSVHRVAEQMCKDLMNQWQHLKRVVDHFTIEQIANNRLQLKATVFIV